MSEEYKLGRQIPLATARKGGYFMVLRQDGTINASLDLEAYYTEGTKAALPDSTNWLDKAMDAIKRPYLNNQYGDCVIASLFHIVGLWTANKIGTPLQGSDAEVLSTYRIWNPGRQDGGCDIGTVNNYWRDHGVTVNGQLHKIDSYVSVNNANKDLVKAAIALFGNVKLGIDLPGSWQQNNTTWDVTNSRSVGGHDVPSLDYDASGVKIATWGGLRTITWPAFTSRQYISEAYSCLSPDWYGADGMAPNGIDVATLKSDLDLIKAGQIPSVGPVAPNVPNEWLI